MIKKLILLLLVLTVNCVRAESNIDLQRPLFRFDDTEKWLLEYYSGNAQFKIDTHKLTLSGNAQRIILRNRKFNLIWYDMLTEMIVSLDAKGSGQLRPVWQDAGKQLQYSEFQTYKDGHNTLRFKDIPTGRLSLQYLEFAPSGESSEITLLSADTISLVKPLQAIAVNIPWMQTTLSAPELALKNISGQKLSFQLQAVTSDRLNNGKLTLTKDIELLPGEEQKVLFQQQLTNYGVWHISYTLSGNGLTPANGKTAIVAMTPAGAYKPEKGDFLFGVCSHPQRWSIAEQRQEIAAAALCGTQIMRCSIDWGSLETAPGVWDWTTFDHIVDLLDQNKMQMQGMFCFTARHAAPPEIAAGAKSYLDWSRVAPDLKMWSNYVSTIVKRYSGKIRYWEVWNEPDIDTFARFSSDEYVEMLKTAYCSAKEADPRVEILTSGFATLREHRRIKDPQYQEKVLDKAKGFFDIHAYHEHGLYDSYVNVIDQRFIPLREKTGTTKPWYANETSVSALNGDELLQAVTLVQKCLFAWSRGAMGYNWYDLRNDGFNAEDGEQNYGMLTFDFRPKMVYAAYNMLATHFRQARFEQELLTTGVRLLRFRTPDAILLAAWIEGKSGAHELLIRTDAKSSEFIDIAGNRILTEPIDGYIHFSAGELPRILKLSGATFAEAAEPLIRFEKMETLIPGKETEIRFSVYNPLKRQLVFELKSNGDLKLKSESATIAPESVSHITGIIVPISGGLTTCSFSFREILWQGNFTFQAAADYVIPANDNFRRTPDFVLNSQKQVTSIHEADPGKRSQVWRNPDDLSAEVWLGLSEHDLLIKVVVKDDCHQPEESPEKLWQGDSVQFAVGKPGQALWEIGFARNRDAKAISYIWNGPPGVNLGQANKGIRVESNRNDNKTYYLARVPRQTLGMQGAEAQGNFQFNLLINDNDGEGRKGWISVAPGLGNSKKSENYPVITFQ